MESNVERNERDLSLSSSIRVSLLLKSNHWEP